MWANEDAQSQTLGLPNKDLLRLESLKSHLRTEKTRAIFPIARILFRITSLRSLACPVNGKEHRADYFEAGERTESIIVIKMRWQKACDQSVVSRAAQVRKNSSCKLSNLDHVIKSIDLILFCYWGAFFGRKKLICLGKKYPVSASQSFCFFSKLEQKSNGQRNGDWFKDFKSDMTVNTSIASLILKNKGQRPSNQRNNIPNDKVRQILLRVKNTVLENEPDTTHALGWKQCYDTYRCHRFC